MKKNIALWAVLFIILTIITWYYSFRVINQNYSKAITVENETAVNRLKSMENQLVAMYTNSKSQILYLKEIVKIDRENSGRLFLDLHLSRFLMLHENFYEISIFAPDGREELNAYESLANDVIITPNKSNKTNYDYFKNALNLKSNEFYIGNALPVSDTKNFDENYPVNIHFFTPIFKHNSLSCILALNFDANNWIKHLNDINIGIIDGNDMVLYNGFKEDIKAEYIDFNTVSSFNTKLYLNKKIALGTDNEWTIFTKINENRIENLIQESKQNAYKIAAILTFLLLLLFWTVYNFILKKERINELKNKCSQHLIERNTFLTEIHHRVKNNLQIITSLLSLQASAITDGNVKNIFNQSQHRINSMTIVHEMLYQQNEFSNVNFNEYLKKLADNLLNSLVGQNHSIAVNIAKTNVKLNINTAIPLGLLVNEIITNSIKYAFKKGDKGKINIEIKPYQHPNYILLIGDNGNGYTDDMIANKTTSLGLKLIHKLTQQLKGNMQKDESKNGTNYIISFKEIKN